MNAPPPIVPPSHPAAGPPPIPSPVMCRECGRQIAATDAYCRHCGKKVSAEAGWQYRPWAILFLAFAIMGPFAIPLIWKSPYMARNAKVVMTALVVAYVLLVFYLLFVIGLFLIRHQMDLGRQMEEIHRFLR